MKKLATLLMASIFAVSFSTAAMANPKHDDSPKKVVQHKKPVKKVDKKIKESDVKQVKKADKKAQKPKPKSKKRTQQ